MGLITLARARQNQALSSVSDEDLQVLIDSASAYIVRYCDREFESGTATDEKHDGNDLDYIFLSNSYISSITSASITEGDGSETSIAVSSPTSGKLLF